MTKSLLIPLNNVAGKGDFCAEVDVGIPPQRQHMLVDSGSSTFALSVNHYDGHKDQMLEATELCQHVKYGLGEWLGPVVNTQVSMGHGLHSITAEQVAVAIAETQVSDTFAHANGMLGLAYSELNTGHHMQEATFPWRPYWQEQAQADDFISTMLSQPRHSITPFFDTCAAQDIIPDKFGFLVHRSSVFQTDAAQSEDVLMQHPLNRGLLALGNPHLHTHLHHADFKRVPLVCDKYYNVDLLSVRIADGESLSPPPFEQKSEARMNSNSFIDSGASIVVFPQSLFKQVMKALAAAVPEQAHLLDSYQTFPGKEIGVPLNELDLSLWPNIDIELAGHDNSSEILTITPHSYWQTHAPASQQASFKLTTLPGWDAQTILGLPLMCEYYTVFDRTVGSTGEIAFANPKIAPHRMKDQLHHDSHAIKTLCTHLLHHAPHSKNK